MPTALAHWADSGLDVRIYSSGSVDAQKLFFAHTSSGDLTPHLRGHYDTTTGPKREATSYRARLHPQAGGKSLFTLGAWDGDRLVGALTCEHENRKKVLHIAHLIGMMVDDAHAGRGIGGLLLRQALELLRREPLLETLTLSVTAGNEPAIALYRRAGFTRYGHLPRAIRLSDGRYYAKDLMSLDLRP